jgi:hypothetical protein
MADQECSRAQVVIYRYSHINLELANRIIMMMMGSQEEQLLDGVAMTTSISCSAQEEPQEPRI